MAGGEIGAGLQFLADHLNYSRFTVTNIQETRFIRLPMISFHV